MFFEINNTSFEEYLLHLTSKNKKQKKKLTKRITYDNNVTNTHVAHR